MKHMGGGGGETKKETVFERVLIIYCTAYLSGRWEIDSCGCVFLCVGLGVHVQIVIACCVVLFLANTILQLLFVEMYVNVVFVKLFVQHSEFNSC